MPGTYQVQFVAPDGYHFTDPNLGADDSDSDADQTTGLSHVVTLNGGDNNTTIDAGIYQYASVGDFVWFDTDSDGIQDSGEDGIGGVAVTLYDATGAVVATTTTDTDGYYMFDELAPGDYTIRFTNTGGIASPAGNGDLDTGSDADPITGLTGVFTLNSGDARTDIDAGYMPPASIGGTVWGDLDNDGVIDAGEHGIPGVTVTLTGVDDLGNPVTVTTTTDGNGNYLFDGLRPGTYTVTELQPPAWFDGSDVLGTGGGTLGNDSQSAITLAGGQHAVAHNFGEIPPSSLGDFVWIDSDRDGVQDTGEVGLAGVTVNLYAADGVTLIATAVTDTSGYYLFPGLAAGTYTVKFVMPSGMLLSPTGVGGAGSDSNGLSTTVTLGVGESNMSIDLGVYAKGPGPTGGDTWMLLAVAVFAALAGGGLLLVGRRRRRA